MLDVRARPAALEQFTKIAARLAPAGAREPEAAG
jgi:hypothetical protein